MYNIVEISIFLYVRPFKCNIYRICVVFNGIDVISVALFGQECYKFELDVYNFVCLWPFLDLDLGVYIFRNFFSNY